MPRSSFNTRNTSLLSLVLATACSAGTEGLGGNRGSADGGAAADANIADSSIIDADAGFADARELCGLTPGEIFPADEEYPRLLELTVENPNPRLGESVYFRGRVADDREVVEVFLSGAPGSFAFAREFDEDGRFEVELPIDACVRRPFSIDSISIRDRAGRSTILRGASGNAFDIEHGGVPAGQIELGDLRITPAEIAPAPTISTLELLPTSDGFEAIVTFEPITCVEARVFLGIQRFGVPSGCFFWSSAWSEPITLGQREVRIPVPLPECQRTGAWSANVYLRTPTGYVERDETLEAALDLGPLRIPASPVLGPLEIERIVEPEGTIVRFDADIEAECESTVGAILEATGVPGLNYQGGAEKVANRGEWCVAIPSSAPRGTYRLNSVWASSPYGCLNGFDWNPTESRYKVYNSAAPSSFVPDGEILIQHP
jgi:hypothetical protein